MDQRGRQLAHRGEHEAALVQARMRHFEDARVDRFLVEEQQIEIDDPRPILAARLLAALDPLAAHDALEREHPAHQHFGGDLGLDFDDAV